MSKPDPKESKDASPSGDKAGAGDKAAAGDKKASPWLPAIAAVVLAPAISFAVAQFVLLPKIQKQIALQAPAAGAAHGTETAAEEAPAESGGEESGGHGGGHGGKEGKEGGGGAGNYEFSNVVVNLSGTMGTRYLKTSFIVTPSDKKGNLKGVFEAQKAKLTDVTLNVLSSLTLADLEEPGSKNVLREKLVATYNQALGKRLVEQVYFSDFVIQ